MIKILATAAVIVGVGIALIGTYLAPDDLAACGPQPDNSSSKCQKADAIVAVSGGNTTLRTAEAIRLFQAGWADRLIFSGAAQDDNSPSNALVMKRQALAAGVSESDIVIDESSRTTHQNAKETGAIIDATNVQRLIVVTSPYHQRRAGLEFQRIFGPTVIVLNHPALEDPDWGPLWWLTPHGWWLAGGELVKIGAVQSGNSQ